jgi:hypothetical protein
VRIRGLRRTVDLIVRRVGMEVRGEGPGAEALHRSIATERRALESELRQRGVHAAQLTDEARGVRGWLGWLAGATPPAEGGAADEDEVPDPVAAAVAPGPRSLDEVIDGPAAGVHPLRATIAATRRMAEDVNRRLDESDAMLQHLTGRRRVDRRLLVRDRTARVSISFRPMRAVTRAEVRDGAVRVWVQAPLAVIGPDRLEALTAMVGGDAGARQAVHEAMLSTPFQTALAAIETLGGTVARTRGRVHDLGASFDRVNRAFFGGRMERPTISWSRSDTRRMFGHYEFVSDALVVSSSLDRAEVPAFVIDFIVFHELLHKKHGLRWSGARAHAHTAAFRRDERRFPRMAEAEAVLRRIAAEA